MSTYVTNGTQATNIQSSGGGGMDDALKRMVTRGVVTGVGAVAYSMFVLGVPFSSAQITNAAALAGTSVSAELISRQVVPMLHVTSSKSIVNYGIESAIAGVLYAAVYPRLVVPGSSVSMMTLAKNGALVDVGSSLVSGRVHDALFTARGGY